MVILTPITINNHFNNANYVTKVDHLCSERHTFNFLLKKVDFRGSSVSSLDSSTTKGYVLAVLGALPLTVFVIVRLPTRPFLIFAVDALAFIVPLGSAESCFHDVPVDGTAGNSVVSSVTV